MNLRHHTFLVTGGASGLGGATTDLLAAEGASVVIADINREAGTAKAEALGDAVRFVETDVTDAGGVQRAIDAAVDVGGALHGVINCAGIAIAAKTVGREGPHDLDAFRKVIEINLIGMFNVIRLAAAQMSGQEPEGEERGVIVNTASIAAYDGQIGQVAYAASKGGVVGMTLPIARDLARSGIRVVTVAPGTFDTPLLAGLPEAARQALGEQVPFPSRLGRPAEFAALTAHVIQNAMLNGEVIRLDGALRMPPK